MSARNETGEHASRFAVLDGWRALSITLVLLGHLFPMGPKAWALNGAVATTGMAIFFALSGFLVTTILLRDADVVSFLIRRIFRIVPLAWTGAFTLAILYPAEAWKLPYNLLFIANLPPQSLFAGGMHLWSLGVEVHFYLFVALLVLVARQRALLMLPVLCVAITVLRIQHGAINSPITWMRGDEILAGATLALVHTRLGPAVWHGRLPWALVLLLLMLLAASADERTGGLNYARGYLATAAVGVSMHARSRMVQRLLATPLVRYVADVSYALYVFHGILSGTWLGAGATLEKYAKRPLLLGLTFLLAHLSTNHFERPLLAFGKRLDARLRPAANGSTRRAGQS
jgi:peptidoglycan/LPS O-acetylase OafA/YrhL